MDLLHGGGDDIYLTDSLTSEKKRDELIRQKDDIEIERFRKSMTTSGIQEQDESHKSARISMEPSADKLISSVNAVRKKQSQAVPVPVLVRKKRKVVSISSNLRSEEDKVIAPPLPLDSHLEPDNIQALLSVYDSIDD